MRKGLLIFLASLFLLSAGCTQPPVEATPTLSPVPTLSPPPAPSPSIEVTVHWDVLESAEPVTVLANRWYEEYTDDLIPSDDYGPLVPYIGGEASTPWWDNSWYYGLATLDGTIVTDAVFLTATYDGYYDNQHYGTVYPDPMVLYLSKPSEEGRLIGLAAGDGSWYTGQIYTATLCESQDGSLMVEVSGDVVMIDWKGREVFRWPADNIPLPNFHPDAIMWNNGGISGHWFRFVNGYDYTTETPPCCYVDLRSGAVQDTIPDDWVDDVPLVDPNAIPFGGGWYLDAEGSVEIHLYSGETFQYPLPKGYKIRSIDGDRVLLYKGNSMQTCMLTDLEGNILVEAITDMPEFTINRGDTPSLIVRTVYGPSYFYLSCWKTVLDRDGIELLTARDDSLSQWGNYLTFADDYYYRLTDLEGNDLIRIPRFNAAD